jgi:hypothetical protein
MPKILQLHRKILLASTSCRTRQFLPTGILINGMEILRDWRVQQLAPLPCPEWNLRGEARHAL